MNTSILIVEDEGVIALDMKKKLEHLGYSVPGIVDNGEEALGAVETLRPSLVLMDINIKGSQDGIEVAELIRARFHIPIIFVTGNTERQTLERARLTEPFGYTVKPVRVFDLRPQIEMALWKHAMESRLRASEAWLSATFRNVADALIATDSEGNVAMMNALAEGLTGWQISRSQRPASAGYFPGIRRGDGSSSGSSARNHLRWPGLRPVRPYSETGRRGHEDPSAKSWRRPVRRL